MKNFSIIVGLIVTLLFTITGAALPHSTCEERCQTGYAEALNYCQQAYANDPVQLRICQEQADGYMMNCMKDCRSH